jgi:radical SAM protein with 4Fe4S-binding SPASM domain
MIEVSKILVSEKLENRALRHRRREGTAPVVVACLTRRCNLNCLHCYSGGSNNSDGVLSKIELERLLEELADWGSPFVIFSGGEPFLRRDIFELGSYALDLSLPVIISSNGTLITKEKAREAAKAGFSYVGVSLDGLAKSNDAFRRGKGAFKMALRGMRNLKAAGIKTGLRFTMTRLNWKELPGIMALLVREGFARLCVYHLEYGGRGKELQRYGHDLSQKERRKAIDMLFDKTIEVNSQGHKLEVLTVGNYADAAYLYLEVGKNDPEKARTVYEHFLRNGGDGSGEKLAYIDERGFVYPSQFLRIMVGTVRETPLREIWEGDNFLLRKLRNRENYLQGRCAWCSFLAICRGGSRARALAVYNDFRAPDPSCYLTLEEISVPPVEVGTT